MRKHRLGDELTPSKKHYLYLMNKNADDYLKVTKASLESKFSFKMVIDDLYGESVPDSLVRESPVLWDFICERFRRKHFTSMPSRLESVFAFRRKEDANRLWQSFENEARDASVSIEKCSVYEVVCEDAQPDVEFDMAIIDSLSADMNYDQALDVIRAYWREERSSNPLMESLLAGRVFRSEIRDLPEGAVF